MMDYITKLKAGFTVIFAALTVWLGELAWPVYVMVAASVLDYATGLAAAPSRSEKISSYKGIQGIAKKVCMWLLVVVGAIVDWLLVYVGLNLPFASPVAITVSVWIVVNELISILENIADVGVPLPKNLVKLVSQIKDTVEGDDDGD